MSNAARTRHPVATAAMAMAMAVSIFIVGTAITTREAAALGSRVGSPHVAGTATVPVYSYANAIRESVWVEVAVDSD
jgi:X-Pro dipeptidyl-peptidase